MHSYYFLLLTAERNTGKIVDIFFYCTLFLWLLLKNKRLYC
jgi:hypothetical protein